MASNLFEMEFTPEEQERYIWLRTVEWQSYPAFIAVGVGALLFLVFPPWYVIIAVVIADFIWFLLSRFWYSYFLSNAAIFIHRLKWVTASAVCIYFVVQHRYSLAVVAVLSPIIFMFCGFLSGITQGIFPRLNATKPIGKRIIAALEARKVS